MPTIPAAAVAFAPSPAAAATHAPPAAPTTPPAPERRINGIVVKMPSAAFVVHQSHFTRSPLSNSPRASTISGLTSTRRLTVAALSRTCFANSSKPAQVSRPPPMSSRLAPARVIVLTKGCRSCWKASAIYLLKFSGAPARISPANTCSSAASSSVGFLVNKGAANSGILMPLRACATNPGSSPKTPSSRRVSRNAVLSKESLNSSCKSSRTSCTHQFRIFCWRDESLFSHSSLLVISFQVAIFVAITYLPSV